jgi:transposase
MEKNAYSTYDVRLRAVRAVISGEPVGWVAKAYQVDPSTLHRWVNRYRLDGEEGLRRKQVEGRPRKIDRQIIDALKEIILKPATEFGFETDFWTCRRMMIVAKSKLRVKVSQPTMWRMLRSLDLTYQKQNGFITKAATRHARNGSGGKCPKSADACKNTGQSCISRMSRMFR